MNISTLSARDLAIILVVATFVVGLIIAAIAGWLSHRKRRSERLRTQFGGSEYDRAVNEDGSRRLAEAGLNERTARVESLNIRPLARGDRARFMALWRRVEAR